MSPSVITNNGKKFRIRRPTDAQRRRVLQSYGAEIGSLVFEWNRLHENLAKIFVDVVASEYQGVASEIWYSVDSDFSQRKMLRAAASKAYCLAGDKREDVYWILNKIDDQLRHGRNAALHAPLSYVQGIVNDTISLWIDADVFSANPKAKSLVGKELKAEFQKLTQLAKVLGGYCWQIDMALRLPTSSSWPERPLLPHAHRTKSPVATPRKNTGK